MYSVCAPSFGGVPCGLPRLQRLAGECPRATFGVGARSAAVVLVVAELLAAHLAAPGGGALLLVVLLERVRRLEAPVADVALKVRGGLLLAHVGGLFLGKCRERRRRALMAGPAGQPPKGG